MHYKKRLFTPTQPLPYTTLPPPPSNAPIMQTFFSPSPSHLNGPPILLKDNKEFPLCYGDLNVARTSTSLLAGTSMHQNDVTSQEARMTKTQTFTTPTGYSVSSVGPRCTIEKNLRDCLPVCLHLPGLSPFWQSDSNDLNRKGLSLRALRSALIDWGPRSVRENIYIK